MGQLLSSTDKRTNYCGELSAANVGERVCVMGWAQKQRDLGSLIFIDLRDRTGIVQLALTTPFAQSTYSERTVNAFSKASLLLSLSKAS